MVVDQLTLDDKAVIVDFGLDDLSQNKLFIPEFAAQVSHTLLPTCFLCQRALNKGFKFITPDVYLSSPVKPNKTLLICHVYTSKTKELIKNGAKPVIVTCQESPFVVTDFYVRPRHHVNKFKHSFVFRGIERRIGKKTIYHEMFFPQPYNVSDFNPKFFNSKKLLVLMCGSKFSASFKKKLLINFLDYFKPCIPKILSEKIINSRSMSTWFYELIIKIVYGYNAKDIFFERRRAINYFFNKDFDLYGRGWDKISRKDSIFPIINKIYRGEVGDKLALLRNYKFTLCFENAIFPGYITEKIFDAIFAGSVPIYYGAPDIKNYIPAEAFIDFRDFKDYNELHDYINSMDECKYAQYLTAMKNFVCSKQYYKFSQEYYAETILKIITEEFSHLCQK